MENKFLKLAKDICDQLRAAGLYCRIDHLNRFRNSAYIRIANSKDIYDSIRLSDHGGKPHTRFSVRSDIVQSKNFIFDNQKFLWYTLGDVQGMIRRIKKEYAGR